MIKSGLLKVLLFSFVIALFFTAFSCKKKVLSNQKEIDSTFSNIIKDRKIIFATSPGVTNYFIYKAQPMGFQLELIQRYAEFLGVKYEVKPYKDVNTAMEWLRNGECDVIADGLTLIDSCNDVARFSVPLFKTNLVLVSAMPKGADSLTKNELVKAVTTDLSKLQNKTIYVASGVASVKTLYKMSRAVGSNVSFVEVSDTSEEELIEKVANRKIEYTICHEHIANANSYRFPQIIVLNRAKCPIYVTWAVRKDEKDLFKSVNYWLNNLKNFGAYRQLYQKYYKSEKIATLAKNEYHSMNKGKLSAYDALIKKYSKIIGWDWRLVASLIYQESKFDADTVSCKGAFGLMQLMPNSAKEYDVTRESSASENIRAGVALIKWINKQMPLAITDSSERIKFVLASYNIGYGHILDARSLTRKYQHNPNKWDWNVSKFLRKKAFPKYYNDPVVHNGPTSGGETCRLVEDVTDRYIHYKNLLKK